MGASHPIAEGVGGGENWKLNFQFHTQPSTCTSCASFSSLQLRIGEAFGFEVSSLFGRRPSSKRAGRQAENVKETAILNFLSGRN